MDFIGKGNTFLLRYLMGKSYLGYLEGDWRVALIAGFTSIDRKGGRVDGTDSGSCEWSALVSALRIH
jgi:hypothetical protein